MAGERDADDDLVLGNPVPPAWSVGGGGDLRVPTVALAAEVSCVDGRQFPSCPMAPALPSS